MTKSLQACKHLNASAAIPRWTNWFCKTTCRPLSENLAHCCKRSTRHQRESRNVFGNICFSYGSGFFVLNHLKFSLSHEYRNGLQHVEVIATFPWRLTFFFFYFFIKAQRFAHQMTTEVAECIPGPTMDLKFLRLFLGVFVRLFETLDFL